MSETSTLTENKERTPGVVLFAAVLNFLGATVFYVIALTSIVGLVFGASTGAADFVQRRFMEGRTPPITVGMTFFFAALFVVMALVATIFLLVGVGLLKKKPLAWYAQVAMSVFGLLAFPIGTVLNSVILYFFFQCRVRDRFKV